jgi:hypothetical protein
LVEPATLLGDPSTPVQREARRADRSFVTPDLLGLVQASLLLQALRKLGSGMGNASVDQLTPNVFALSSSVVPVVEVSRCL